MILAWLLENTLVAGLIALVVAAAVRALALRPSVAHVLWIAALGVLLMPRVPWIATPGEQLRQELRAWLGGSTQATEVELPALDPALAAADPLRTRFAPSTPLAAGAAERAPERAADDTSLRSWTPGRAELASAAQIVWLAGALIVLGRSARRIVPFHRLVKRSPLAARALQREVLVVARRLEVRAPEVRVVGGVASPSIWCLGRPRLLWPAESALDAPLHSGTARGALIAHELAHLARRDHWVSWLEIPAAALAWWNPLFWWIRGRIRLFAELSCDAWAMWAYPADRRAFAEALIEMQARTRTAPVTLQGLGATDSECKDFERRLDMIMKKGKFPGVSKGAAVLAAALAVLSSPGFSAGDGHSCAKEVSCASPVVESRARGAKLAAKAGEELAAEQYEAAFATLNEVLALDSENGWAHGRLGYVQLALENPEAAQQSFARQYELGYERAGALYNRSCAHARANELDVALECLAAAVCHGFADADWMGKDKDLASLRSDARFQTRFHERVQAARTAGELRRELAQLEQEKNQELFLATHAALCDIVTADGKLQSEHGHLALEAGDHEGAARAFARQAEVGWDAATAYYNRACALARAGGTAAALADLRSAAERGMGYDGIAADSDLDLLRKLPAFAELQQAILAQAESTKNLKALLTSKDEADAAELAALADDAAQPAKIRALAGQALGRLQLEQQRFADAYATFERSAELGVEVRQAAFGMAQALSGVGKRPAALAHLELALELGYADPDAVKTLLDALALTTREEAETLVGRAAQALAKSKAEYGTKQKAWAAGMKALPVAGTKVAQDS